MARWTSHPVELPASAPEELKKALASWEKPVSSLDDQDENNSANENTETNRLQPVAEPQSRKRKRGIQATDVNTSLESPSHKKVKQSDASLDAALQRMYPPKEIYHVKASHTVRPDQWHPIDQTTQDFHPSMRQPLKRQLKWDDRGITLQTGGKVPHETVLDFLVDVMRNKHWRGAITSINPNNHKQSWPRLHFYDLTKTISPNPFLLRLSQMLEGRFTAATARKLPYVPSVTVQGLTNQSASIKPCYIAAILIQALGKPNPIPCSLCASTWNEPNMTTPDADIRPFTTCVSLSSLALPPRFAACANHFWTGSITDCSCVNITAPLHQDERYDYFLNTFASNASNYPLIKSLFKDEFLHVASSVPEGFVKCGPFWVRADVAVEPRLFARGLDLLAAVVEGRVRRGDDGVGNADDDDEKEEEELGSMSLFERKIVRELEEM